MSQLFQSGGNSFSKRGVAHGDVAYVIAVSDGQLFLGGRMRIKRVDTRREAVRNWGGTDINPEWLIGDEGTGTPLNLHRRLAAALSTRQLRFISSGSEPKGYTFISNTQLDSQTTRGVRELTPESASLLDRIIDVTDSLRRSKKTITVTEKLLRTRKRTRATLKSH